MWLWRCFLTCCILFSLFCGRSCAGQFFSCCRYTLFGHLCNWTMATVHKKNYAASTRQVECVVEERASNKCMEYFVFLGHINFNEWTWVHLPGANLLLKWGEHLVHPVYLACNQSCKVVSAMSLESLGQPWLEIASLLTNPKQKENGLDEERRTRSTMLKVWIKRLSIDDGPS